jgi:hypothetical protein
LQLRDYAAPRIYNSIITEFGGYGVRVDDTAGLMMTNGLLDLRDNLWWGFATNGVALPQVWETAAASVLFEAGRNNEVVHPMLTGVSRRNDPAFVLDPLPMAGSPALTSARTAPNDGFYTPVNFKGAFYDANWAADWTALSQYGILATRRAGELKWVVSTEPPVAPTLTVGLQGSQLVLSFETQAGYTYQIESAPSMVSPSWSNEGEPIVGGSAVSRSFPVSGDATYFRVMAK